mgnify:CR=1 FL=1
MQQKFFNQQSLTFSFVPSEVKPYVTTVSPNLALKMRNLAPAFNALKHYDATHQILMGYMDYYYRFKLITKRARIRFEQRDWHGIQDDAKGRIDLYRDTADPLLLAAKPPTDATRPGGNGAAFDWSLLDALDPKLRFMLSGGLDPESVADAVARIRPAAIDVSSGVEAAPGRKDPALIAAFVAAARKAERDVAARTSRRKTA